MIVPPHEKLGTSQGSVVVGLVVMEALDSTFGHDNRLGKSFGMTNLIQASSFRFQAARGRIEQRPQAFGAWVTCFNVCGNPPIFFFPDSVYCHLTVFYTHLGRRFRQVRSQDFAWKILAVM